jgi:hypothetical protein
MTNSVKSFQQLDPIGGYGAWAVTFVMSIAVLSWAIVITALNWTSVMVPWLAIVAIVAAAAATVGVLVWSSAFRAPFPLAGAVIIFVLGLAAVGLTAAAWWGGTEVIKDEWAPVVLGLLILQLGPYRPVRELVIQTILSGLAVGILALIQPQSAVGQLPALVVLAQSIIPLLALGFGSAAYASALGKGMYSLQRTSGNTADAATIEVRERIARSVHHDRVTILNLTVVPFFTRLMQSESVTAADREQANEIANSIRSVMVADVDRTWLDVVADELSAAAVERRLPGSEVIEDDDRLASLMTREQRTITRAVIVALFDHPGFDPDGFAILITRAGAVATLTLSAKLDQDESIQRSSLAPYIAVLRVVFSGLQVAFDRPELALRFSYEHK